MKLAELEDRHYQYIEDVFGYSKDEFLKVVEENGSEADNLFNELSCNEYDNAIAADIVNALEDYYNDESAIV